MWKTLTTILILSISTGVFGQKPTQTIRGKLTDALNGQALAGAYICLPGTEPLRGGTSNETGEYRLEEVPIGRYRLEVSFLGYETIVLPDVLVESGKEVILNINLFEASSELAEITVGAADVRERSQSVLSLHTLKVEESFRFPATFNDPARLAQTVSGVTNTNDQANHISIRGNSPGHMSWRLEGAEIVNPNHLGNAGTFRNRPVSGGGGVNILSAQLLGNSNFYKSAFPAQYGNVLGGVMDMRFRNGNNERHEFTAQAGLIGFDFAAEGPISKNDKGAYLINYRYSFVGLLGAMGVDFGGETISFQDLAFNVNTPFGKNGIIKVFGMGGLSKNELTAERDPTSWKYDKDRYDSFFKNTMGAIGTRLSTPLNDRLVFNAGLVTSFLETTTRNDFITNDLEAIPWFPIDTLTHRKVSLNTSILYKLNAHHNFKWGVSALQQYYDFIALDYYVWAEANEEIAWLIDGYGRWEWTPSTLFNMRLGLHYTFFTLSDSKSLEPRFSANWLPTKKDRLSFAYGLHSQIQSPYDYFKQTNNYGYPNLNLDLSKAHHFVLGYSRKLNSASRLGVELYYQSLYNIPTRGNYSVLNVLDWYRSFDLGNNGAGTNYGIELAWERDIVNGFYYRANASVFDSKYKDSRGDEYDTRFSNNYVFNGTVGKEFYFDKKDKQKTLGINLRAVYAGGLKTTEVDRYASRDVGTTVYEGDPFILQQKAYFKVDFRCYLKNNKKKYTSTLALDLQNVTNANNVAFEYYDRRQDEVLTQYQLGLIPNLSYRIEF